MKYVPCFFRYDLDYLEMEQSQVAFDSESLLEKKAYHNTATPSGPVQSSPTIVVQSELRV
jgi:hypothetical protein